MRTDPQALRQLTEQIYAVTTNLQDLWKQLIEDHFEAAYEDTERLCEREAAHKTLNKDDHDTLVWVRDEMESIRHSLHLHAELNGHVGIELVGVSGYAIALGKLADLLTAQATAPLVVG